VFAGGIIVSFLYVASLSFNLKFLVAKISPQVITALLVILAMPLILAKAPLPSLVSSLYSS